jgi:hypothetical protein
MSASGYPFVNLDEYLNFCSPNPNIAHRHLTIAEALVVVAARPASGWRVRIIGDGTAFETGGDRPLTQDEARQALEHGAPTTTVEPHPEPPLAETYANDLVSVIQSFARQAPLVCGTPDRPHRPR